jgi:hypothetical protein
MEAVMTGITQVVDRLRRKDRGQQSKYAIVDTPLPIRAVCGNVIAADTGVWTAWTLGQAPYHYRTESQQVAVVESQQQRWAELAGMRVHLRVTSHPYPHAAWAQTHDRAATGRIPDTEGAETWADDLAACQQEAISLGLTVPATYLFVRVSADQIDADRVTAVATGRDATARERAIREQMAVVADSVARDGFWGTPATTRAIAWLTHTSVALGVPAPDVHVGDAQIGANDMGVFCAPVAHVSTPYAATSTVLAIRGGTEVERHVTVLSMGRCEDRPMAGGRDPWIAYARRLGFPVEWSATLDVLDGADLAQDSEGRRRILADQEAHYAEHGEEAPAQLARALTAARRAEDETRSGRPEVAVRLVGPVRVAITGRTVDETARRVREFVAAYGRDQRIEWVHPRGQQALATEFVPCADRALPGMDRWMPAAWMASGIPTAATKAGTGSGPFLGSTWGHARTAVHFDPCWGPQHGESGLILACGGLGSGKSVLVGVLAEQSARLGRQTIIFDPSGPLARLTGLRHLRPHSRVVDLASACPGILNPYALLPDPDRGLHPDGPQGDAEHHAATRSAAAERAELMIDAAMMLMPGAMLSGPAGGTTIAAIRTAVAACPTHYGASPWDVVAALNADGETGSGIARILSAAAEQRGANLIFPGRDDPAGQTPAADALLTVITTPGLTPPAPGSRREFWTWGEQIASVVLHLAGRYASRAMYASRDPKLIAVDEGALTGRGDASLANFLDRGSRDSRKWNTGFVIASQTPADFAGVGEIRSLIGAAFVGRMADDEAASAALTIADTQPGIGHEQTLRCLNPGQFLLRGWGHSPQLMHVALTHRPELAAVLDTTPAGASEPLEVLS